MPPCYRTYQSAHVLAHVREQAFREVIQAVDVGAAAIGAHVVADAPGHVELLYVARLRQNQTTGTPNDSTRRARMTDSAVGLSLQLCDAGTA